MKLKIMQRYIDKGVPGDSSSCPIALAMLEQVPDCDDAAVDFGPRNCGFLVGEQWSWFDATDEMVSFMRDFDDYGIVSPCVLDVPIGDKA